MTIIPVVLASGPTSDLWPLTRDLLPTQFTRLCGEHTPLQQLLATLTDIPGLKPAVVVCNEEHRFLAAEQIRQAATAVQTVLLEPEEPSPAASLTLAAGLAAERVSGETDDPILLVVSADCRIKDPARFRSAVERGSAAAERGEIAEFCVSKVNSREVAVNGNSAITPPNVTALGYVGSDVDNEGPRSNVSLAQAPVLSSAEDAHGSCTYMMRRSVWLKRVGDVAPDAAEIGVQVHRGQADGDFFRPQPGAYQQITPLSIAVAVNATSDGTHAGGQNGTAIGGGVPSTARNAAVIASEADWAEIWDWSSLFVANAKDPEGNVVHGDVYSEAVTNSLLMSRHRLLAVVGLDDVTVIVTSDAVLVARMAERDKVQRVVERLSAGGRDEQRDHREVQRPWGSYEIVDEGPRFQVKRLTVQPGAALSLQMHHHRAEHWVVVRGTAKVTRGDEEFLLTENQSTHVPVAAVHRLENPGNIPLEIIEVQTGGYLGEDDITRLEDRYDRHVK